MHISGIKDSKSIIEAMNYKYDNPESGILVDVDSNIIEAATKSVTDKKTWESLALFVSMSSDKNAVQALEMANQQIKISMSKEIETVKTI